MEKICGDWIGYLGGSGEDVYCLVLENILVFCILSRKFLRLCLVLNKRYYLFMEM